MYLSQSVRINVDLKDLFGTFYKKKFGRNSLKMPLLKMLCGKTLWKMFLLKNSEKVSIFGHNFLKMLIVV